MTPTGPESVGEEEKLLAVLLMRLTSTDRFADPTLWALIATAVALQNTIVHCGPSVHPMYLRQRDRVLSQLVMGDAHLG
jgi:hypothetical protein